ncbi:acyl-ACP--UDP-N-acetylglucosamine O-acyltransferase [Melioribacteraceae bacterium 4301-Me]|uniref:acyl-ACP--UDP-N-acetylglucosamine O-acyltransferase n=1 Tax=Pyranulibacter aquaticus TaxID=3163344 RepID=UPI0035957C72
MTDIHPTAIVSPHAILGENVTIGPYAVIYDDVVIGNDCKIGPHAVIYDGARIGNRVKIFQGASIANIPQDLKFKGDQMTYFYIGDDTIIREFATLHRGTNATGKSSIGKNTLIMAYAHVAHDCYIGNNCIIVNSVQIGGHVTIEDWAIIGGSTPVHQFCKVGQHAMVGGGYKVSSDVPPYVLAGREPLRYEGLNIVGLKRRGFTTEDINTLKKAYQILYDSGLLFSDAKEKLRNEYSDNPLVQNIVKFLDNSTRSIIRK